MKGAMATPNPYFIHVRIPTCPITSNRVSITHSASRNDPNGYAPRTPHLFADRENQFEGKWKNPACSRTGANGKTNLVEYAINNTPGTNGYKFDRVVYTTWNVGKGPAYVSFRVIDGVMDG